MSPRRLLVGFLLALAGPALTGCLPLSVNALYENKDAVQHDKRLLGTWRVNPGGEQNGNLHEIVGQWRVTRPEGSALYHIRATDKDGHLAHFRGGLVRLGDRWFLDLQSETTNKSDANPWLMFTRAPCHALVRLRFTGAGIDVAPVQWQKLDEKLRQDPNAIAHVRFGGPNEQKPGQGTPVLTASTKDVRAFVKNELTDDPFFTKWFEMRRKPNASAKQPAE